MTTDILPLRVVFLGSDGIALPLLESLGAGAGASVIAVFTQPDRPVGRGQKVQPNAIKTWAQSRGLPVYQPEKLTPEVRADLAGLGADVGLVMAYGHILKDDFIGTPRLGMLNLHTSLLPRLRGASPIQTAVASGERETGVSLMRIVRKLDAGPVTDVERVAIGPLETAADVEAKLSRACVPLVARALPRLADGTLHFVAQEDASATYCRKLEKTDGAVDFGAAAAAVAARINGLYPWPACSVEIAGQPVKLGLAEALGESSSPAEGVGAATPPSPVDLQSKGPQPAPGTVLGADNWGLCVQTAAGVVRLRRLQRPGGRMLEAGEFLRGFPVAPGTVLPSRAMPPLVSVRT